MITGGDFIQLASKWAVLPDGEAVWRTSIGRAYYGAFHCAQHLLFAVLAIAPFKGRCNKHSRVQQFLFASKNEKAREASNLLSTMVDSRNNADYDIEIDKFGEQNAAQFQHGLAIEVVGLLDACAAAAAQHQQMRAEIENWRKINQC